MAFQIGLFLFICKWNYLQKHGSKETIMEAICVNPVGKEGREWVLERREPFLLYSCQPLREAIIFCRDTANSRDLEWESQEINTLSSFLSHWSILVSSVQPSQKPESRKPVMLTRQANLLGHKLGGKWISRSQWKIPSTKSSMGEVSFLPWHPVPHCESNHLPGPLRHIKSC